MWVSGLPEKTTDKTDRNLHETPGFELDYLVADQPSLLKDFGIISLAIP
jgi:hypothetical protein